MVYSDMNANSPMPHTEVCEMTAPAIGTTPTALAPWAMPTACGRIAGPYGRPGLPTLAIHSATTACNTRFAKNLRSG